MAGFTKVRVSGSAPQMTMTRPPRWYETLAGILAVLCFSLTVVPFTCVVTAWAFGTDVNGWSLLLLLPLLIMAILLGSVHSTYAS